MKLKILKKELKSSFTGNIFHVAAKDVLFYASIAIILLLYSLIISRYLPPNPGFNQATIWNVQASVIDQSTMELKAFLTAFTISSILAILLIIASLSIFKEWIWSGILKKKCAWRNVPGFALISIFTYAIGAIFLFLMMMLAGALFQNLITSQTSGYLTQSIAILLLLLILPLINHLINYASYVYAKKRKLKSAIIEPFTSFSKLKLLATPYLIMFAAFFIAGIISNIIIMISENTLTSIIGLLIFILFLSWQRVYLSIIYKRVYI